jgi:hypothetical protein
MVEPDDAIFFGKRSFDRFDAIGDGLVTFGFVNWVRAPYSLWSGRECSLFRCATPWHDKVSISIGRIKGIRSSRRNRLNRGKQRRN